MKVQGQPGFRYRFTFFARQFVSHLMVSLLILGALASGFVYFMKQQALELETSELTSAGKGIVRLLVKEDVEPTAAIQAYRNLLSERKISFILLDKSGEIVYRDPKMPAPYREKLFLDDMRQRIFTMKDNESFILNSTDNEPLVVVSKPIRAKSLKGDMFLFVFSPLQGYEVTLQTFNEALIYMVLIVFVLAVLVSWLFSRNMSKSIRALRRATRQIASGNYASRLPVQRSDELGELSADFNTMAIRLEAASNKLQQYENRRRHFIMDVTHELRTPLTSIRGIIEGLKNGLVTQPEDKYKYYGIIEKETFRLIRLINELLDMEKIEAGMITLHKKRNALRDLLEMIVESLEVLIEAKHLRIDIDCDPDLSVYGDYDRLTQILINLVKNSLQFTEYGSIRLKGSDNETETMIEITDTGRGMTPEELSLIWERFYKADPSRTKSSSETGLGLSIVKQLVEAHEGTITAESTPGIGTTIYITLPKMNSQLPLPAAQEETKPAKGGAE
ncbi:sensor histidine kinase [Paenibacillus rigui]|uniref:histidine kinase n=1 Tax=Paenibacillus rigui TaxID=554312 RepID=A0A229UPX3_9BACL|nr:HAMP domain-containing sensor histidine kinase [Paenibacillus rigui]OXM85472.1 two-component sensor histidine kinase [Paenibacillus rigui]